MHYVEQHYTADFYDVFFLMLFLFSNFLMHVGENVMMSLFSRITVCNDFQVPLRFISYHNPSE